MLGDLLISFFDDVVIRCFKMFPGEEWVTVLCAFILVAVSAILYIRKRHVAPIMWLISGISFLIIAVALALMRLDALQLPVTPYLGSLYPGLLAVGIIGAKTRYWKHYLVLVVVLLALIAIGTAASMATIATASRVALHSISGLVIVVLPLVFVAKKASPPSSILVSLGGLLISVGGLALATLMAGRPLLPFETVIYLLHPLLFLSVLIMALGLYVSGGLGLEGH